MYTHMCTCWLVCARTQAAYEQEQAGGDPALSSLSTSDALSALRRAAIQGLAACLLAAPATAGAVILRRKALHLAHHLQVRARVPRACVHACCARWAF